MKAVQHLPKLFGAIVALSLSGCARQSAPADRAQPDPIAVRVATPKHVRVPAEVVVSGTVETSRGSRGKRHCRNAVCADKCRISSVWQSDSRRASRGGLR